MAEIITVEKDDFPIISASHRYGIHGNFNNQIYEFFKKYEPGRLYILSGEMIEDGLSKYVDVQMEQYYNMYGIYFKDGILNPVKKWMAPIPQDLFVKNDMVAIEEYLSDYAERYNLQNAEIGFCVVEMEEASQKEYISSLISDGEADSLMNFYDSYTVVNYDFGLQNYKDDNKYYNELQKQYAGKTLINFAKIMIKYNCAALREKSVTIASYKNVIDEVLSNATSNTVYYYAPYANDIDQKDRELLVRFNGKFGIRAYANLAAYLALKFGIRFDIPDGFENDYVTALHSITNDITMYACDYLNTLKNPPSHAILCRDNGFAFIYQRVKRAEDLFKITVAMSELQADDKGFRLCSDTVETVNLNAFDTEIVKITDYYNMHTLDYKHGLEEMRRLQLLTDEFQKLLTKHKVMKMNISLDCSNTFIFKYNNKFYIALLLKKEIKYYYKTLPIARGYAEADIAAVDENILHSLLDMRAFTDYDTLIDKDIMSKLPKLNDTAIGIITQLGTKNQENIADCCGLPFDTVCLWDPLALSFRSAKISRLSSIIPVIGLRKTFLTFFGGPQPCAVGNLNNKPTLTLERNLWTN